MEPAGRREQQAQDAARPAPPAGGAPALKMEPSRALQHPRRRRSERGEQRVMAAGAGPQPLWLQPARSAAGARGAAAAAVPSPGRGGTRAGPPEGPLLSRLRRALPRERRPPPGRRRSEEPLSGKWRLASALCPPPHTHSPGWPRRGSSSPPSPPGTAGPLSPPPRIVLPQQPPKARSAPLPDADQPASCPPKPSPALHHPPPKARDGLPRAPR